MVGDILFLLAVLTVGAFLLYMLVRTHDNPRLPKDFKLRTTAEMQEDIGKRSLLWLLVGWLIPPGK